VGKKPIPIQSEKAKLMIDSPLMVELLSRAGFKAQSIFNGGIERGKLTTNDKILRRWTPQLSEVFHRSGRVDGSILFNYTKILAVRPKTERRQYPGPRNLPMPRDIAVLVSDFLHALINASNKGDEAAKQQLASLSQGSGFPGFPSPYIFTKVKVEDYLAELDQYLSGKKKLPPAQSLEPKTIDPSPMPSWPPGPRE
jgi:hypothetical protein